MGAIVEGLGDRLSIGSLISKTSIAIHQEQPAYVAHVIECGGWSSLKKTGGIERYCRLMVASCDVDRIIAIVDLDDGCPVEEFETIEDRVNNSSAILNKPVSLCLLDREYETWFLQDLIGIQARSPEINWNPNYVMQGDPKGYRDAKGEFSRSMRLPYRPSIDQDRFTKRMSIEDLLPKSRSLQKLGTCITTKSRAEILQAFPEIDA